MKERLSNLVFIIAVTVMAAMAIRNFFSNKPKKISIYRKAVKWDSTRCYSLKEIDSLRFLEDQEMEEVERESIEY